MLKEISAGGLVVREGKVLLVKVENLEGEVRWTFPKGHLEAGEGPRQAALREVEEETGWACRIQAPLTTARYRFLRHGREVSKQVRWYLMAPLEKVGSRDGDEIMAVRWAAFAAARKLISYRSDIELFEAFHKRGAA
ncbi:MAG: NUDIX domain-containing protein [Elusimicrobia bacterium]|nr:NUDIX domain-containing protein [Elusimicrobiota bacterium]